MFELSEEERTVLRIALYTKITEHAKHITWVMSSYEKSPEEKINATGEALAHIDTAMKRLRELAP